MSNVTMQLVIVLLLGILEGCHALLPPGGALVPFYFPGGTLPLYKKEKKMLNFLLVVYDTSSIREPPKVS
jgi:hypothetical protein